VARRIFLNRYSLGKRGGNSENSLKIFRRLLRRFDAVILGLLARYEVIAA
jgi:hypothetical protein